MKVAILHDWLIGYRGGERVLEALCELYPNAPIYTLIHKKGSSSKLIESKDIRTSVLNKVPGIYKHYKKFLPLMPTIIKTIHLKDDFDLVISSSHCVIKGVNIPKNAKHICYIHTPMRYMYDQFDTYFRKGPLLIRLMAALFRPYLQFWDKGSNKKIDVFIANSKFVQNRVKKYYNREALVIHPFVDLKDFSSEKETIKEDYYLMVTAFAPNKRLDIAIDAFNMMPEKKLKIIGKGSEEEVEHFKKMVTSKNIEFLGEQPRPNVVEYFERAKGFIFPGVEDFGITPLEAMAAGTPVIAYKAGGVLETVNAKTGVFFKEPSPRSLSEAIKNFEQQSFDQKVLKSRAQLFSKDKFLDEFNHCIKNI